METIRTYLLSVIAAALLSGILSTLTQGKLFHGVLRLVCGAFLIFTVLQPVFQLNLKTLSLPDRFISQETAEPILEGVDYAAQARARLITQKLDAYIQDKAQALGAQLTTQIKLTDDATPLPEEIHITGTWSGYARSKLETMLAQDLGIPKEKQIWIHLQND